MRAKVFILLLFCCLACRVKHDVAVVDEDHHLADLKYVAGSVFKAEGMAGCSFLVKLEDDRVLEPLNLSDSLKKDKLKLLLRYHPAKNQVGICMMGEMVTIDDVQYRR